MNEVTLNIGGRAYTVSCEPGQEDHIADLGDMIEAKLNTMGQLSPQRSQNLLFAGLFLADELQETKRENTRLRPIEDELSTLKRENSSKTARIEELVLQSEALTSERDTMRSDYEALKNQIGTLQSDDVKKTERIAELMLKVDELKAEHKAMSDEAKELEDQAEKLNEEVTQGATKMVQLEEKISRFERRQTELTTQYDTAIAEHKARKEETEELYASNEKLEQKVEKLKAKLEEADERSGENASADWTPQLEELASAIEKCANELEQQLPAP
jgi:cell division protein ZapA